MTETTQTKTTLELVDEHNRMFREPERMTVETIEELLVADGFTPHEIAAGILFILRDTRRVHPEGEFDSGGRWYPDQWTEKRDCCRTIRGPSRSWPYSYLVHCRTIKHIAWLYGASTSRVRKAANLIGGKAAADGIRELQWVD